MAKKKIEKTVPPVDNEQTVVESEELTVIMQQEIFDDGEKDYYHSAERFENPSLIYLF